MITLTSREFNQDTARAKRAAEAGPVFITDRGEPAHVLLTIQEYRRLHSGGRSIADMLAADDDIDLEEYLPKRHLPREIDLS